MAVGEAVKQLGRRCDRHHGKGGILETLKITDENVSSKRARHIAGPTEPDMSKLARLIGAYAPHDGTFHLRIPGLHASRPTAPR